jgi:hypothetical protein
MYLVFFYFRRATTLLFRVLHASYVHEPRHSVTRPLPATKFVVRLAAVLKHDLGTHRNQHDTLNTAQTRIM